MNLIYARTFWEGFKLRYYEAIMSQIILFI